MAPRARAFLLMLVLSSCDRKRTDDSEAATDMDTGSGPIINGFRELEPLLERCIPKDASGEDLVRFTIRPNGKANIEEKCIAYDHLPACIELALTRARFALAPRSYLILITRRRDLSDPVSLGPVRVPPFKPDHSTIATSAPCEITGRWWQE